MDMNPSQIREVLQRYGVSPNKGRGQNFLVDERVAEREVGYLDPYPGEIVLEVGPGLGILTHLLLERTEVVAIELEKGLCDYLQDAFGDALGLIHGDALKMDFPPFDRFISNLPYGISSPLIFKLLGLQFERGVIMVQREFAERMLARAGEKEYSRLSVSTYYRAECELLEIVPRTRFWPEPEVDSAMILLKPRKAPFEVSDEGLFLHLVNLLFQHRRKKIGTVLKKRDVLERDRIGSLPFIEERVEVLTPEQIGELADAITESR